MRVTINCCKNFWRSPWMQRRRALESGVLEREASEADVFRETSDGDQLLIETVRRLPEKYRAVIHLFYYEELSVEEIGRITDSKESTVRTRLTRARRALKSLLKEEGGDFHVQRDI